MPPHSYTATMIHPGLEDLSGNKLPLWDLKEFILEQIDEGYYGTVYKVGLIYFISFVYIFVYIFVHIFFRLFCCEKTYCSDVSSPISFLNF